MRFTGLFCCLGCLGLGDGRAVSSSTFDFSILQCYLLVSSLTDLCCLFMRLLGVFSVSAVRSVIGGLSTFVMKFSLVIRATTWEVLRSFLVNDVLHFFSVATCFGYHHPSVSVGRLINFDRLIPIHYMQVPRFQKVRCFSQPKFLVRKASSGFWEKGLYSG